MQHVNSSKLIELQSSSCVRNVCILAHVDHGKTTLADNLIASNGIMSSKLVGKLRYMDSREDEQKRGITMKSSSIALYYKGYCYENEWLINLIDSPGHVDFSSEVSTAVRLCDGAIIVVDIVEGVCPQTRASLQQAYTEKLVPILALNKIDRLIVEKRMTALDAYYHIVQILEQINAVMGNIFASDIMSKEIKTSNNDYTSGLEDSDDSSIYFSPERSNVIFCSAIDGWAFTISDFSKIYESKLNILHSVLEKVLWGDFYYNTKKKCYSKGAQEKAKKPMFVQFILENIWNLYETILFRKDKDKIPGIVEKLQIKLTARDLRHNDGRVQLQSIFTQWLPISRAVLERVVGLIRIPIMPEEKAERLMCSLNQNFSSYPEATKSLKLEFMKNSGESEHVIVFVSKMFAVNRLHLPENKAKPLTHEEMQKRRDIARQRHQEKLAQTTSTTTTIEDGVMQLTIEEKEKIEIIAEVEDCINDECDEVFIAFARVYSGTLRKGAKMYVLSPKHDPRSIDLENPLNSPHITEVTIGNLYLLMGREMELLEEVPAGNIVGISGLQDVIFKTATLSSNIFCPSFTELTMTATPILRVAIEPKNPLDMPKLLKGLKMLNQADACVQVLIQETGEHVLLTLGEVHLERCITDLEETFAKIKLNVSKPIVPFRETIVPKETMDMVNEAIVVAEEQKTEDKVVTMYTPNKQSCVKILAVPLPTEITELLDKNSTILSALSQLPKTKLLTERTIKELDELKKKIQELFAAEKCGNFPADTIDRIWCVGPKKCGPNILLNMSDYKHVNFWETNYETIITHKSDERSDYDSSFLNGFQMATLAGPLCEEPLRGVCFILQEWTYAKEDENCQRTYGPYSGQIMSIVKESCRKAFQNQPQRLVTPMYSVSIVVSPEVLGKMYAVIARRHGRIILSDLIQGSGTFSVSAVIPVTESYNFSQEFRKETSGLAYPQLLFSHWEVVDIDPFWVPSTEEEYLHFGEKADTINRAKTYMDSVRKRKGLAVEEKLVEFAEKQRTLSKNK